VLSHGLLYVCQNSKGAPGRKQAAARDCFAMTFALMKISERQDAKNAKLKIARKILLGVCCLGVLRVSWRLFQGCVVGCIGCPRRCLKHPFIQPPHRDTPGFQALWPSSG